MIFPSLVPDVMCKTDIHVEIHSEEISEDGAPMVIFQDDLKCNYQDKAKTILTAEKKLVQISGQAMFNGDIAPEVPVISGGTVTVFGVERQIVQGMKARNPDGTVNYTRLDVM